MYIGYAKKNTKKPSNNNMICTSTTAIVNWKGDPEGISQW